MKPYAATARKVAYDPNVPVRGDKMVSAAFTRLCRESNTPFAWYALELYRSGRFNELVQLKIDPFFYSFNNRPGEFELDYQVASFFKKYKGFALNIDRKEAAYGKWLRSEESCRRVNNLFRSRWEGISYFPFRVEEVYHLARRKIVEVLKSVGPNDLDFVRHHVRHGPGSDTAVRKQDASGYAKYQGSGQITPTCVELYEDIFGNEDSDYRVDLAHHAEHALASRLSFVPKTALIDRAICTEPRWNIYLQLGIGDLISKRLRRYGIDLTSQHRNQEAARSAYHDGLATVDLSSASDSIAVNLVIDMLACADDYWLSLLLKSRTHYTSYSGNVIRLEKISSMGNGYTFPLETLIFYCFAWATAKFLNLATRKVTVFGDDIIVPRGAYSLLVEVLEAFGFSVNSDKSFASGDFFESCGKDYFRGREVRPFFVKEKVLSLVEAYVLHNMIIDWAGRNQVLPGLLNFRRYQIAYTCVFSEIPKASRFCGPAYIGGVLHRPFIDWNARPMSHGIEGYRILNVRAVPRRQRRYGPRGHLYTKLHGGTDCGHWVTSPGVDGHVVGKVLAPTVPDYVLDVDVGLNSCIW